MGCSFNVSVVKDSEKLQILLEKGYAYKVTNGYAVIVHDSYLSYHTNKKVENIASILKSIGINEYVEADADYFGGGGEQSSIFFNLVDLSQIPSDSINSGLRLLGVILTDENKEKQEDEFEVIGLGSIRDNDDVIPQEIHDERKKQRELKEQEKADKLYESWKELFLKLSEKERILEMSKLISAYDKSKPMFSNSSSDTDNRIFDYNENLIRYFDEK
jgi:hypothetical protein